MQVIIHATILQNKLQTILLTTVLKCVLRLKIYIQMLKMLRYEQRVEFFFYPSSSEIIEAPKSPTNKYLHFK
jgi:hypothetical protein